MRTEFKVSLKRTNLNRIRRDRNKLHREPILRQYLVLAHQIKEVLKTQPNRTSKEKRVFKVKRARIYNEY